MKQPTLFDEPSNGTETQSAEAKVQRQVETARDPLTPQILTPILANILLNYENLNEEASRIIDDTLNFLIDTVPEIAKVEVKDYVKDFSQFPIGISQFSISKIGNIIDEIKGKWIVAIDESMIDDETLSGNISYRHSAAFGMRIDEAGGEPKERMLALSSVVKIQEEEHFRDKMMFISYLMNLFTAYYTAKFLTSIGEKVHSIIIHGPLIRQLGPFLKLVFQRDVLHKVFSLGKHENILPEIKALAEGALLQEILDSEDYANCLEQLRGGEIIQSDDDSSTISGVALYLCLLKRLYELSKSKNFYMIGCVETARSSEYSDIYFRYQVERYFDENEDKRQAFEELMRGFGIQPQADLKPCFLQLREKAGWDDERLSFFSIKYDAAQQHIRYTNPVPIRRYFSVSDNQNVIGDAQLARRTSSPSGRALDRTQNLALHNMLQQTLKFPNYKVLMSYVRTSELKAPIRVEFFETGKWQNIMPFVYAVSQPYSSFGLPIFLYFADKIARVPKSVISTVTTELLMKKAIEYVTKNPQGDMHFVQIVNGLLNKFRRDFTQR